MAHDRTLSRGRMAVAGAIGVALLLAVTRAIYGAITRVRAAPEAEAPETTDEAGEVWVVVDEVWIT